MSVYCTSDIHGCMWAYNAIMDFLKPDDILYFLGDAADRGSDGWEIIKKLFNDPRVIYIKGNHDDFLLKNFYNYTPNKNEDDFHWDDSLWLWFQNGGEVTYNAFLNDTDNNTKYNIIQKLKIIPCFEVYFNNKNQQIFLSHAGFNPEDLKILTEEDFIWDRYHFIDPSYWAGQQNQVIVHGHTPIPLLIERQQEHMQFYDKHYIFPPEEFNHIYWYSKNHKVDIDCGTVWTDMVALLNLDTWEEIIFKKDEVN